MKKRLDRNMLSVIFALAWPTMLEELMQTAVQYIDTAMVGTLGTQATAAVGATGTVSWLVGSTVSAVGVGFLALISQSYGAGDKERAKRASAQAVMMTLVVGLLFTAITTLLSGKITQWMQVDVSIRAMASQYFLILYSPMLFRTASIIFATVLRSVGDTKTPMRVSLNMNLINIVLNFLLIYSSREVRLLGLTIPIWGVGWGINGAAVASAVAYTYGGIAMTARLWKHPDLSPKGHRFLPDGEILRPCWKVAFPNMLQRFGTSLGYVAFAAMINALGDTSTAAHTIANTVESLFYIPGWGMQTAAATLAGNAMGAEIADGAVIVKMIRVMMLAPVLLVMSLLLARRTKGGAGRAKVTIPWFAFGFLAVIGFNSLDLLPEAAVAGINSFDTFLLTMAMTALGAETSIEKFKRAGAKPFLLAGLLYLWLLGGGYLLSRWIL